MRATYCPTRARATWRSPRVPSARQDPTLVASSRSTCGAAGVAPRGEGETAAGLGGVAHAARPALPAVAIRKARRFIGRGGYAHVRCGGNSAGHLFSTQQGTRARDVQDVRLDPTGHHRTAFRTATWGTRACIRAWVTDGRVTVAPAGRRAGGNVRARAPRLGCSALGDGLLTNACSIVPRARYVAIRSSRSGTTTSRRRGRPKCSRPSRATAASRLASAASTGWGPTSSSARTATGGHGPHSTRLLQRALRLGTPTARSGRRTNSGRSRAKLRCRCPRPTRLSRVSRPERRSSLV